MKSIHYILICCSLGIVSCSKTCVCFKRTFDGGNLISVERHEVTVTSGPGTDSISQQCQDENQELPQGTLAANTGVQSEISGCQIE